MQSHNLEYLKDVFKLCKLLGSRVVAFGVADQVLIIKIGKLPNESASLSLLPIQFPEIFGSLLRHQSVITFRGCSR